MREPAPDRRALLAVLEAAVLRARDLAGRAGAAGGDGRTALAEIASLMDAVHNLPRFLGDPEGWDESRFRGVSLASYDSVWAGRSGLSLAGIYGRIDRASESDHSDI